MWKQVVLGVLGFCGSIVFMLLLASPVFADEVILPVYQDTYAEEGYPTAKVWNTRNMFLGYDNIWGKARTRIYIQFDFSTLPALLYSDPERIQYANIQLFQYQRQAIGSYNFYLFSLLYPFLQEEVDWYTQPIVGELIGEFSVTESLAYQSIDITGWVKSFLQSMENNGFALVAVDEYSAGSIFWSESCTVAGVCAKPRLVINYDSNMPPLAGMITSHGEYTIVGENQSLLIWEVSTDPEGDPVTYTVMHSAAGELKEYPDLSENNLNLNLNNGSNLIKIAYCDPYRCTESNQIEIIYDDQSPSVPEVNPLPPYTSGDSVEISFSPSIDSYSDRILYQICYGYSAVLDECQLTEWTENTSWFLSDIQTDGKIYFFVRAKDELENISEWSTFVSTIVDNNSPVLGKLTVQSEFVSPKNPTSAGVFDEQIFSGEVNDPNLAEWELIIMDRGHQVVFTVTGTGSLVEYIYNPNLSDGLYYAFLEAVDLLENTARSNIVSFIVDDTSPVISGINIDPAVFRTVSSEYLTYTVNESAYCEVTLNGVTISQSGLLNYISGSNKLIIKCTDNAGNSVASQSVIKVDYIPPGAPLISVVSTSLTDIRLEVTAEVGSTVTVFASGVKLATVFMDTNVKKFTTGKVFYPSLTYEVRGFAVDMAGNQSNWSEKTLFKIPLLRELGIGGGGVILPQQEGSPTGECTIIFSADKYYETECNVSPPYIKSVSRVNSSTVSGGVLSVEGVHTPEIKLNVIYKRCKKKSFFNPKTWFNCLEETYFSETMYIDTELANSWIYDQIRSDTVQGFITSRKSNNGEFTLEYQAGKLNVHNLYFLRQHFFLTSYTSKGDYFGNFIFSRRSTFFTIPPDVDISGSKYFSFMFLRLINVTQWHGYTAFQSPHKGIDFGALLEPIISPADGTVEVIAWDSYGGECSSGGNILLIKHDNGMYSAYFHLANYNKANGSALVVGERVSKGQVIATSGNTGAYNCQPLGYHLHFELRLGRSQSTHVDPVPYIDVNWAEIFTSGASVYPGRLTGDNPHPEY